MQYFRSACDVTAQEAVIVSKQNWAKNYLHAFYYIVKFLEAHERLVKTVKHIIFIKVFRSAFYSI